MEPIESSAFEDFHGGQLVVDLPHMKRVLDVVVNRLGVGLDTTEVDLPPTRKPSGELGIRTNRDLDLALIAFEKASLEARATALRNDPDFLRAFKDAEPAVYRGKRPDSKIPDLDLLLFKLRQEFTREFTGWAPEMGKNRVADGIEGSPGMSGGGVNGSGAKWPEPANEASFDQTVVPPSDVRKRNQEAIRIGLLDTRLFDVNRRFSGAQTRSDDRLILGREPVPQSAGHGTFVAGRIMARVPHASLIVRAVLDSEGARAALWDMAEAMVALGRNKVQVFNMSWVYTTADHEPSLILNRALACVREVNSDIVLVAAAGNHGESPDRPSAALHRGSREPLPPNRPVHPAATPGVIGVGAFKAGTELKTPEPADFSPQPAPWISLGAPGDKVVSTYLKGTVIVKAEDEHGVVQDKDVEFTQDFAQWSGTSFAAGYVTGEIVRLMGAEDISAPTAVHRLLQGIPDNAVQPYAQ
jgi:subtilisin family serine protease